MNTLVYPLAAGITGVVFSVILIWDVLRNPEGTEEMRKISIAIRKGASAFLVREWKVMSIIVLIFAVIVGILIHPWVAVSYIFGTFLSAFSGFVGMTVATRANVRTTNAARHSAGKAIDVAFSGGAVMGITVSSLGILGLVIVYFIGANFIRSTSVLSLITGYSMGASFVALFARVGVEYSLKLQMLEQIL